MRLSGPCLLKERSGYYLVARGFYGRAEGGGIAAFKDHGRLFVLQGNFRGGHTLHIFKCFAYACRTMLAHHTFDRYINCHPHHLHIIDCPDYSTYGRHMKKRDPAIPLLLSENDQSSGISQWMLGIALRPDQSKGDSAVSSGSGTSFSSPKAEQR